MFSGIKGGSKSGGSSGETWNGSMFTEGEVHADLVMVCAFALSNTYSVDGVRRRMIRESTSSVTCSSTCRVSYAALSCFNGADMRCRLKHQESPARIHPATERCPRNGADSSMASVAPALHRTSAHRPCVAVACTHHSPYRAPGIILYMYLNANYNTDVKCPGVV